MGIVFAPQIVELVAPRFHEVEGKFELCVSLARLIFPYLVMVSLAAAFMGILNARGVYFLPALASALFNFTSIVTGVVFSFWVPQWGWHPIEGMALGILLGGLVQFGCQLPRLYKEGYQFKKRQPQEPVWHKEPALKSMLGLMGNYYMV